MPLLTRQVPRIHLTLDVLLHQIVHARLSCPLLALVLQSCDNGQSLAYSREQASGSPYALLLLHGGGGSAPTKAIYKVGHRHVLILLGLRFLARLILIALR